MARIFVILLCLTLTSSCMNAYRQSVGGDTENMVTRIYLTDFNSAWGAVLESLKNSQTDVTNREAGFVQTRWTDNTAQKNFVDSFGSANSYLKAQFRFRVTLSKGAYYNGQPVVKIAVTKEQLIQHDVLEGWRPTETDGIEERTLLYRIGRLIFLKGKLSRIEDEKAKKALEENRF